MIYFDQSATSYPKLDCVKEAVQASFQIPGNANRSINIDMSRNIHRARKTIQTFFNCDHVIFNSGCTESLNTVIFGLCKPEDHVITTYAEHNSVLRPLYVSKVNVSIVEHNQILESIQENTKMIVLSQCSNVTGEIYPLKEIGQYAKNHNIILVVDAAQSAGHIPIDMKEENIDILCFSGHKGLQGLSGIGGICINGEFDIKPLKYGGTGMDSYNENMPISYPEHLEAGTLNMPGIESLRAGIQYISNHFQEIQEKEHELLEYTYHQLKQLPISLYNEPDIPIFIIGIKNMDASKLSDILYSKYHIIVRTGAHCAPLMMKHLGLESVVRISLSHMNTKEEVDVLIQALKEIIEEYDY